LILPVIEITGQSVSGYLNVVSLPTWMYV
jgi:hypothetical protein